MGTSTTSGTLESDSKTRLLTDFHACARFNRLSEIQMRWDEFMPLLDVPDPRTGRTAFMEAGWYANIEIVDWLISQGPNFDVIDHQGFTARQIYTHPGIGRVVENSARLARAQAMRLLAHRAHQEITGAHGTREASDPELD